MNSKNLQVPSIFLLITRPTIPMLGADEQGGRRRKIYIPFLVQCKHAQAWYGAHRWAVWALGAECPTPPKHSRAPIPDGLKLPVHWVSSSHGLEGCEQHQTIHSALFVSILWWCACTQSHWPASCLQLWTFLCNPSEIQLEKLGNLNIYIILFLALKD